MRGPRVKRILYLNVYDDQMKYFADQALIAVRCTLQPGPSRRCYGGGRREEHQGRGQSPRTHRQGEKINPYLFPSYMNF